MDKLNTELIVFSNTYNNATNFFGEDSSVFNIPKIIEAFPKEGLFRSIANYSNIPLGSQASGNFVFYFDAEQNNKDFFIFGTDNGACDFAVNIENGKVALLDSITGEFFFYIAESEISFLKVLIKIIQFETLFLSNTKVDGELTRKIRKECIEIAGGSDYEKLYNYIIVSEDDMPTGPLILP